MSLWFLERAARWLARKSEVEGLSLALQVQLIRSTNGAGTRPANRRCKQSASNRCNAMKYAVKLMANGRGRSASTVSAIVAYTPKNTSFAAKAATIRDVSSSGRDG